MDHNGPKWTEGTEVDQNWTKCYANVVSMSVESCCIRKERDYVYLIFFTLNCYLHTESLYF